MTKIREFIKKSNVFIEESGLNPQMTDEELYIHNVHKAVDEGTNLKGAYDHDTYIKCRKAISIHGNVREPSLGEYVAVALIVALVSFAIIG